jgi:hypothetical protein
MINPHKIGRVLWAESPRGYLVPLDLHNRLIEDDEKALDKLCKLLLMTRKLHSALDLIRTFEWADMEAIKPWLIASIESRTDARSMQANGEWAEFWNIQE